MKLAIVDLSNSKITIRELEKDEINFIGGKGIGFRLLQKYLNPKVDPLSENFLVFSAGLLTGLKLSGMARGIAVFKSPLTNFVAESSCGGYFAPEIRKAGYAAVAFKGKARNPVVVKIEDDEITIENTHLWGKDSFETEDEIKKELGRRFQVVCIGQAGENLVRFASIEHAKGREFGRCGGGTVMGSMKLKAIVVKGNDDLEAQIDNFEKYSRLKEEFEERIASRLEGMTEYGTPRILPVANEAGVLPTRYWRDGEFEAEKLSPEWLKKNLHVRKRACRSCRVACGKVSRFKGKEVDGPEYETLFALGSLCGVGDAEVIAEANLLCDRYGLDTISTGNAIALLFNLQQKFGDGNALLELIRKIAFREDIGDLLAEGVERAAKKMGTKGIHVKGLELAGYDPRGLYGMALGYAVCYRGGCHIKSVIHRPNLTGAVDRFKPEGQSKLLVRLENFYGFTDSLVACRFVVLPELGPLYEEDITKLYNAVSGSELSVGEMLAKGAEVVNLARKINESMGLTRNHDTLPDFFFKEPLRSGNSKGAVVKKEEFERMLEEYYRLRGW
jgi:aldehyde:ferredoxin oxidoreductase